jgi:DNA-binding transcriptional ArsR family regulator
VYVSAHIGNVPVEEWLPFLAPVVALYVYGRHKSRRRREAIERLPDPSELLTEATVSRVMQRWSAADHRELSPQHVSLLYPPGPDGVTAGDLATRIHVDRLTVERLLEELQELGYVDFDEQSELAERRAWLTVAGYDLVNMTERELLAAWGGAARGD